MNHHLHHSSADRSPTFRALRGLYDHVIKTSYLVDVELRSVTSSMTTPQGPSEPRTDPSFVEDHLLKVRFYLNGAKVKRKITTRLAPGRHQLMINGISYQAAHLKVMILRGEEGVISLHSALEESEAQTPLSHQSRDTQAATLFESRSEPPKPAQLDRSIDAQDLAPHDSYTQPPEDQSAPRQLRSAEHEIASLHEHYERVSRAYQHAYTLLTSWISEATRQPQLSLSEWREGLEVLEVTLNEQVHELHRLRAELRRWGESPRLEEGSGPKSAQGQRDLLSSTMRSPWRAPAHAPQSSPLSRINPQRAHIDLEVDRGGEYQIEVSYDVRGATWEPVYQARLTDAFFELAGTKPRAEVSVNLEMSARFAHATCEIWQHIEGEFCLYPAPRSDFPALSYPSYERFSFSPQYGEFTKTQEDHASQRLSRSTYESLSASRHTQGEARSDDTLMRDIEARHTDWRLLLHNPLAPLTHLFSDQATMWLTLELEISATRPRVEVMARGKLDTLLPLAGGSVHRFVDEEWLGVNRLEPLALNEQLNLKFGIFPTVQSDVKVSRHVPSDQTEHEDPDALINSDLEEITITLHNTDDQVRTLLIWQDLTQGVLINDDPERSPKSAPVGWVLSADRKRLTRWISLPPHRQECIKLSRRPRDQVDARLSSASEPQKS